MSTDWKEIDVESLVDLIALVAEHVLLLDKVGVMNGQVWHTDYEVIGGVCKFNLDWSTVKEIMNICIFRLDRHEENIYEAWYLTEEGDGMCDSVKHEDADVTICVAALRSSGWKGDLTK